MEVSFTQGASPKATPLPYDEGNGAYMLRFYGLDHVHNYGKEIKKSGGLLAEAIRDEADRRVKNGGNPVLWGSIEVLGPWKLVMLPKP